MWRLACTTFSPALVGVSGLSRTALNSSAATPGLSTVRFRTWRRNGPAVLALVSWMFTRQRVIVPEIGERTFPSGNLRLAKEHDEKPKQPYEPSGSMLPMFGGPTTAAPAKAGRKSAAHAKAPVRRRRIEGFTRRPYPVSGFPARSGPRPLSTLRATARA